MKPKHTKRNIIEQLQEHSRRINETQPIIASRYCVVEVTPSRRYSDEYQNGWTDTKYQAVSGYFYTKADAEQFIEEHEPDDGNHFIIRQENKRRIEQWVGY